MRSKLIGCLVFCIQFAFTATSQSIYNIEYSLKQATATTNYYGFLVRYDDGGGLLRIRYATGSEDVVKEMDIIELPAFGNGGVIDSNSILLKAVSPKTIVGSSASEFTPPIIVFRINPATDFFDPVSITFSETSSSLPANATFSSMFLEKDKITKAFLSQYFSEDESFFSHYFTNVTRALSPAEKKIRLHLLVVADTLDKSIGKSCAKDIDRTMEMFTGLTNFLGIKLLPTIISGKQYSKKNIEDVVKKLTPSANDIVVFYYTGHGFRIPEKPKPFPNLKLKHFPTVRENFRDSLDWARQSRIDNIKYSMNIEEIFNSIKAKNARFNLVISDCCNDDIFSVNAKGTKPGKTKSSGVQWSEENVRNLFLNEKRMSILVTAALEGQRACSNDDFGSFFTYFFKSSMETYCSKMQQPTTWDVVIQSAQKQTTAKAGGTYCKKPYIPENLCRQQPVYIKR